MSAAGHCDRVTHLAVWEQSVASARYVDEGRAEALGRLGIETVGDLLCHYPFRYIDLTSTSTLADVKLGTDVTVVGRVHDVKVKKPRPRMSVVEVAIVDGTGVLIGVWFNQQYMAARFVEGERVAFAGTVRIDFGLRQMRAPFVEKLGADDGAEALARILPVHRATEGLSTNWIRTLIGSALNDHGDVPDFMPAGLRARHDLLSRRDATRIVHFPTDMADAENARRRLAYEELLCVQVGMALRRHRITVGAPGVAHKVDGPALEALRRTMPFTPTPDQTGAIAEILADMETPRPMNRLLLGDVGTGKSLVAAHALCAAVDSAGQAAMMAPTEVLAQQYAEKLGPLLDAAAVPWALLTGSTPAAERKRMLAGLASGEIAVAFGTHALLEEAVVFSALSLVVVDEQHRFGVTQRLALRSKGRAADMLVMTATPIPRSLALTLYGDLEASYVRQRPGGVVAGHVTTELVHRTGRERAYRRVRSEVASGRQAYVVCALVDESDSAEARSAVKEAERLTRTVFPELRVGLLTGRMKSAEKAAVMRAFRDRKIDILVATTVIEVGIDVPNATVMIVENAERFGLSQLHQLRGRIGRGEHPGTFLVFADPKTPEGKERMQAIVSTDDGFALAEADMRLRGEGQLLGVRQSGLPELRIASLAMDGELLELARADARAMVDADPCLDAPHHAPLADEARRRFGKAWEWVSAG